MVRVHVLNIDYGDCVVVEFPSGNLTVVDVNRRQEKDGRSRARVSTIWNHRTTTHAPKLRESGLTGCYKGVTKSAGDTISPTDPISYIKQLARWPNTSEVFRFISTHPHMNHVMGLYDLYQEVGISNAWVLPNSCTHECSQLNDSRKRDWDLYTLFRDSDQDKARVVRPLSNQAGDFWTSDGIRILAPDRHLLEEADKSRNANAMSYVLMITHGYSKAILGGDAEKATWDYIVETYADDIAGVQLLKASHHGQDRGYYQPAVKLMRPRYTAVAVEKNPESTALNNYRRYSNHVVSARWYGTMVFELDELGNIAFKPEYGK